MPPQALQAPQVQAATPDAATATATTPAVPAATAATATAVRVESLPDPEAQRVLPRLCARYRALKSEQDDLESQMRPLKTAIDAIAGRLLSPSLPAIEGDTWRISRRQRSEARIVPELLLDRGVDMDTIDACTRVKTSEYFEVRGLGKKPRSAGVAEAEDPT